MSFSKVAVSGKAAITEKPGRYFETVKKVINKTE